MITKKHVGERLLEVDNVHIADCGPAPSIDASDKYVGYFENPYGEQWVFVGDRKTDSATIRGGDVEWATEHEVSLESPCPDMILNEPEKLWIITCFMAMSNTPFDKIVASYNKAAERVVAAAKKAFDDGK